jgi:hypothetical protein
MAQMHLLSTAEINASVFAIRNIFSSLLFKSQRFCVAIRNIFSSLLFKSLPSIAIV